MKTRIITLLIAITAIIGSAEAQTKINIHQGGEVVYTLPIIEMDSIGFQKPAEANLHNGHEFVDLGLPSDLKWATCNVGATTPEGYGDYFAWGEIQSKDYYDFTTYKWFNSSQYTMTKYCTVDNKTTLELTDDVARINLGGNWRMPTSDELIELKDTNNCTWEWTTQNGVNGYKVTSKINGNSIFLPAAGYYTSGNFSEAGSSAYYWSSSLYASNSSYAYYMYFNTSYVDCYSYYRCYGQSVRAVCNTDVVSPKTKVAIYKDDEVIYSQPISEIDSIKFDKGGISISKYYRVKNVETGLYLNAENYDFHYTGTRGGVTCVAYAEDADQIFKFEESGENYKLKTNSGYYIYCQQWIVDAQTNGVELALDDNGNGTYDIKFGSNYFGVSQDKGIYYPYCTQYNNRATWVLEEATQMPTYTISVSATNGGTATASASSMAKGGSVTLIATPSSGYRFVNWTVNGTEVSTENIFIATITANALYVANFEERTSDSGISLTKEYRIKDVASGCYLNIANNYIHAGGPYGGVNCIDYADNDNQIFMFEASGNNYYLKSKSGYYIYCQQWNVDGLTYGSELTFIDNPDGTYYIKNGANYFKVELVDGVYYPYCDAPADLRATWVLEPVGGEEPEPIIYTVSVSATEGGEATISAENVEEGGSVILTATPETGYRFVNWTLNNNVVSVSNPYIATITENSEYVANFEKIIYTVSASATEGGSATASAESVEQGGSVTLTATANSGYEFVNWTLNGNVVSVSNPYIATITANSEYVANFEKFIPQYVDLGLPSGLKWATCNVGATTPEEYGNYYAWGEITPKSSYTSENYTYNDNPAILPLSVDAANANWGGNWRMPTIAEQEELMDANNCTWEWTTQNGVNGYKVTSTKNGNSIFLPAAGYHYDDGLLDVGSYGYYWSSSLFESYTDFANCFTLNSYNVQWGYDFRYYAKSVRAVYEDSYIEPNIYTVIVSATEGGTASTSATSVEQGESVTITAVPNEGYEFDKWVINDIYMLTDLVCTIRVEEDLEIVARFVETANRHNGFEYVDLGLPSGTKWATCNVGAEESDELGGYVAWGETSSKDSYTAENYTYVNNPATLPLSADVANIYMGGNWRMPTEEEVQELIDNCSWSQTVSVSNLGAAGHHITSKINGAKIFIPATGYTQASMLQPKNYITQIWTSSIDSEDNQYAKSMYVKGTGTRKVQSSNRYEGLPIRAVFREN